jgi:hypothetical protein
MLKAREGREQDKSVQPGFNKVQQKYGEKDSRSERLRKADETKRKN